MKRILAVIGFAAVAAASQAQVQYRSDAGESDPHPPQLGFAAGEQDNSGAPQLGFAAGERDDSGAPQLGFSCERDRRADC